MKLDPDSSFDCQELRVCCVCCAVRGSPVNGVEYYLPESGETVARRIHDWWATKGRDRRLPLERIENIIDLPVCRACLELIIDIERVEKLFENYLDKLLAKLSSSSWFSAKIEPVESVDVIHAAAVAAGILDETGPDSDPSSSVPLSSPSKTFDPPEVLDESSLVVRKKSRRAVKRKVKSEDNPYGTIIVQKRVKEEDEFEVEFPDPIPDQKKKKKGGGKRNGKVGKGRRTCKATGEKWDNMPGVKDRVCPICGITLKARESDFKKHIRVVHSREATIDCKLCSEKFLYHRHLYKHMRDVHEVEAVPFTQQCELCGKVLNRKWCMREHMLSVHGVIPKDRKVFECPHCQRKYVDSHRFRQHVNSHIGVKPYKCPICPISMTRLENLRQHTKRVHNVDVQLLEAGKHDLIAVEMAKMSPGMEEPFQRALLKKCAICASYRKISVEGNSYLLPVSRELFPAALEKWALPEDGRTRNAVQGLKSTSNWPVCESCLDLVQNIEQLEAIRKEFLGILWRRLKKSEQLRCADDVLRAAALAAGILEDSNEAFDSSESQEERPIDVGVEEERQPGSSQPEPNFPPPVDSEEGRAGWSYGRIVVKRRSINQPGSRRLRKSARITEATVKRVEPSSKSRSEPIPRKAPQQKHSTEKPEERVRKTNQAFEITCEESVLESPVDDWPLETDVAEKEKTTRKRVRKPRKRNTDDNAQRLICPICGLMVKGENHMLRKHIRVVHTKEKTVRCKLCPEKFVYYKGLYAHQAKVHKYKVEKQSTQCELCGKVISEKWIMNDHLLVIHGIAPKTGTRPVKECEKCGRKFLCKDKFEDHMNMHNNVRPYGCPICGIRMVKFANLQSHVKKTHDKVVKIKRDAADGLGCELVP